MTKLDLSTLKAVSGGTSCPPPSCPPPAPAPACPPPAPKNSCSNNSCCS